MTAKLISRRQSDEKGGVMDAKENIRREHLKKLIAPLDGAVKQTIFIYYDDLLQAFADLQAEVAKLRAALDGADIENKQLRDNDAAWRIRFEGETGHLKYIATLNNRRCELLQQKVERLEDQLKVYATVMSNIEQVCVDAGADSPQNPETIGYVWELRKQKERLECALEKIATNECVCGRRGFCSACIAAQALVGAQRPDAEANRLTP